MNKNEYMNKYTIHKQKINYTNIDRRNKKQNNYKQKNIYITSKQM